jgi:hypothetical protein
MDYESMYNERTRMYDEMVEKAGVLAAELEADVVWAAHHVDSVISANEKRQTIIVSRSPYSAMEVYATDGTPADILRAVREARNGVS